MLGTTVKIGPPEAWWNRRVPIGRISLVAIALLVGLYIWSAYGDWVGNAIWGIRHQHTASFRGQALRLPWFWREERWTNYNEFELRRQYSDLAFTSNVTVRYEKVSPSEMQRLFETMRKTSSESAE